MALGGNIGDTNSVFLEALELIKKFAHDGLVEYSRFYRTAPSSLIVQNEYLNAVCHFWTDLDPLPLFQNLQQIETNLGKIPKGQDEPRIIDLDLLFYNQDVYHIGELEIPHPRWQKRAFVLVPLSDLTPSIEISGVHFQISDLLKAIPEEVEGVHAKNSP